MTKIEPDMYLEGFKNVHYAVLKDGDIEVRERVPVHFFKLDAEKKQTMAEEICRNLKKKLDRANRR